jgi:hypothetical protein
LKKYKKDHCCAVPLILGDQYQNITFPIQRTFYKLAVILPVYIPVGNTADELVAYQNSLSDKIIYVLTKANAGQPRYLLSMLFTFFKIMKTKSTFFD